MGNLLAMSMVIHSFFFFLMIRICNIFILVITLVVFSSCTKTDHYVIHANLRCVNAKDAFLFKQDALGKIVIVDSVHVNSGYFSFRGSVDMPTMMFLQVGKCPPIDVFVENEDIYVSGSVLLPKEVQVKGSQTHDDFVLLQNELVNIKNMRDALLIDITNAKKQRDFVLARSLSERYDVLADSLLDITKTFVNKNPTSIGAAYFVCMLEQYYDINKLYDIVYSFSPSISNSEYVAFLKDELMLSQKLSLNSMAPPFHVPTNAGDTLTNLSFVGNYVFIDFWASWNEDSGARRSWLDNVYRKYKRSGFMVLAVSLDTDEEDWKKAIETPCYNWVEACDFLYWESPVTKSFRVSRIPYGVLVDPKGKIVAINPRRHILENKLKNIFGY